MSKEYYTNFKTIISELESQAKGLRGDVSSYKQSIDKNENTIDKENKLKQELKNFKTSLDKLDEAYLTKNIPGNMPEATVDQRQKAIKKIRNDYDEINKQFQELNSEKYSFKGQITEDYRNKEELKGLNTGELLQLQKNKLSEQDNQIDDIIVDAKKGTVLANNVQHEVKEQNKKIEQVNEDMDMVDSRMKKLTKRFSNYVQQSSYCCLCFFFFLQAAIFGVLMWVFFGVLKD